MCLQSKMKMNSAKLCMQQYRNEGQSYPFPTSSVQNYFPLLIMFTQLHFDCGLMTQHYESIEMQCISMMQCENVNTLFENNLYAIFSKNISVDHALSFRGSILSLRQWQELLC